MTPLRPKQQNIAQIARFQAQWLQWLAPSHTFCKGEQVISHVEFQQHPSPQQAPSAQHAAATAPGTAAQAAPAVNVRAAAAIFAILNMMFFR
jgi:hypothetical protein